LRFNTTFWLLVLALVAAPLAADAAELRVGATFACPNGITFAVNGIARDGQSLILRSPSDGTLSTYTPERRERGTLFVEQGLLGFFSIWVPDNGDEFIFNTPDGPVEHCRGDKG
jgi:hypothetical protein